MKKTLALVLALALVSALCGMLFVSAEDTNLVAGKSYTISEQFHMGGADVGWGWDENAPASYPDDGNELTDGVIPALVEKEDGTFTSYQQPEWMATNQKTPATEERGYSFIRFDLGAEADLSSAKIVSLKETQPGIQPAYIIEAWISNDGENYELAGEFKPDADTHGALADNEIHTLELALEGSAQYVEFRFTSYGWNFLGEIEVYGSAAAGDDPAPSEDPSEDPSEAPSEDPSEAPSEAPSEDSKPQTGDAGILVFAVLAVVAIAGAAVAVKTRG